MTQAQPQERDIEALAGAMMDEAGLAPIDAWEAACIAVRRLRAQPSPREVALEKALRGARDAIADAPEETWGTNAMGDGSVPGGMMSWPIKDEILHHIDAALASDGREGDQP